MFGLEDSTSLPASRRLTPPQLIFHNIFTLDNDTDPITAKFRGSTF